MSEIGVLWDFFFSIDFFGGMIKFIPPDSTQLIMTLSNKSIAWLFILGIILIGVIIKISSVSPSEQNTESSSTSGYKLKLEKELSYLKEEVQELEWIHIERNTVYLGFKTLPNDYKMICGGAALRGNKAINFGVHVWAVPASNNPRNSVETYYYEVTARNGQIKK